MERDDLHLLKRYYEGECTPDEIARVPAVCKTVAGRQTFLALLKAVDLRAGAPEFDDSAEAYAELERRLAGRGEGSSAHASAPASAHALPADLSRRNPIGGKRLLRTHPLRGWMRLGTAGAVAVALVGVAWIMRSSATSDQGVTRVYTAKPGQVTSLTLDDGTRVTLAPNSTLALAHFGSRSRTVAVTGEGYFEIAHSSGTPFIVRSGNVETRVLGTAFLIRHAEHDGHVHVAVTEGRVRISGPLLRPSGVTLTAGLVGDINDSTLRVDGTGGIAQGAEWSDSEILFHRVPVSHILDVLDHWYGYTFRCADSSMTQRRVTAVLSRRSSAEALAALERLLAVNVAVSGDTVTLVPQSGTHAHPQPRHDYDTWIPNREVGR